MQRCKVSVWLKGLILALFIAWSVFGALTRAHAATTSGSLTENEVWFGTIALTGDVTVPEGLTLTIQPGTRVVFPARNDSTAGGADSKRAELIINGSLIAVGISDDPISFTPDVLSGGKDDWGGIRVSWGEGFKIFHIEYAVIESATSGILVQVAGGAHAMRIAHTTIRQHRDYGVYLRGGNNGNLTLDFIGNQVSGCGQPGLYQETYSYETGFNSTIADNSFEGNGWSGLYLYAWSHVGSNFSISGNTVRNHRDRGISLWLGNSQPSRAEVVGNTVTGSPTGIYTASAGNVATRIADNDVSGNGTGISCRTDSWEDFVPELVVANNAVHDNSGIGVLIGADYSSVFPRLTAIGNQVYQNEASGIRLWGSGYASVNTEPVVALNTVRQNGGWGVDAGGSISLRLYFNEVYGNTGGGLNLAGTNCSQLSHNNIQGNGGDYEIANGNAARIDARSNYWEEAVVQEMAAGANPKNITRIYDHFDEESRGAVDYESWLTAPVVLPTVPVSMVTTPTNGSVLNTASIKIRGFAVARSGVSRVEISTDAGLTWHDTVGREIWSYDWLIPGDGSYTILTRATDSSSQVESPGTGIIVTIDRSAPITSGTLPGNQTWSGERVLSGDVIVPAGVTLTIEPGTILRFVPAGDDQEGGVDAHLAEMIVNGSLVAIGTAERPIVFTSSPTSPAKGNWQGIWALSNGGTVAVTLAHCIVEYAVNALTVSASGGSATVNVSHCIFRHNSGDGFSVGGENGAVVVLDLNGTRITDSSGRGVYAYILGETSELSGSITGNEVDHSGTIGIYSYSYLYARVDLDLADNIVHHNGQYGIYVDSSGAYPELETPIRSLAHYQVRNNVVSANGDSGIYGAMGRSDMKLDAVGNEVYQNGQGIKTFAQCWYGSYSLVLLVSMNDIHDNSAEGLSITGYEGDNAYSVPQVIGNRIYRNGNAGIYHFIAYGSMGPTVTMNRVFDNGNWGFYSDSDAKFLFNEVRDNAQGGVYTRPYGSTAAAFNNLHLNGGDYDFQQNGYSRIRAHYNYWGDATTVEMETGSNPKNISRIYDLYDGSYFGPVDYSHWLTAPVELPTSLHSRITSPTDGSVFHVDKVRIQGVAVAPNSVARVEVSPDGGAHWFAAEGTEFWSYEWHAPGEGQYTILSRVVDPQGQTETPGAGITVVIDSTLPTTSGTLTHNETWSGTIEVLGDVIVPVGITLTILPGTTVMFASAYGGASGSTSAYGFFVSGSLVAMGTAGSPIVFGSSSASPTPGDWEGLRVVAATADASVLLAHCTIQFANVGLSVKADGYTVHLDISDCLVQQTSGAGVYLEGVSGGRLDGSLHHNEIRQTGAAGLHVLTDQNAAAVLMIAQNKIHSNSYGILTRAQNSLTNVSRLEISGNTIVNASNGIEIQSDNGRVSADVIGNEIQQCWIGISVSSVGDAGVSPLSLLVTRNNIHDNNLGITCYSDASAGFYPAIVANQIERCGYNGGIRCSRNTTGNSLLLPLLAFNTVTLNTDWSSYAWAIYSQANPAAKIVWNNLNNQRSLYNDAGSPVEAQLNYWGPQATNEMAASGGYRNITSSYDFYDDNSKGLVNYRNWRTAQIDTTAPLLARLTSPAVAQTIKEGTIRIEGVAFADAGIDRVEVSLDGGGTWFEAASDVRFPGKTLWSLTTSRLTSGSYQLLCRVIDRNGQSAASPEPITLNVQQPGPTTSGSLTHDETWSGVIQLQGDVTVPEGVTLTVVPGTSIRLPAIADITQGGFDATRTELIINGALSAEGNEQNPIVFTSGAASPRKGDWGGLRLTGSARLRYATIEYASLGILYTGNDAIDELAVDHCTIQHTSGDGVYVYGNSNNDVSATIENSTITDHSASGITCRIAGVTRTIKAIIRGNTIKQNGNLGIGCYAESSNNTTPQVRAIIGQNTITNNGNTGVYCVAKGWQYARIEAGLYGNIIDTHGSYGIWGSAKDSGQLALTIDSNLIHHSGTAISLDYASSESTLTVSNNVLHTGTQGLNISGTWFKLRPQILNNSIHHHSGNGATIGQSASVYELIPYLEGNQVFSNGGVGVRLISTGPATIVNNGLYGNSSYDYYNDSAQTANARGNWWGIDTTVLMDAGPNPQNIPKIYDHFDSAGKGTVDYSDWLPSYQIPSRPVLTGIVSPTNQTSLVLTGSKDSGTAIVLNGTEVVALDSSAIWSYQMPLAEGINPITLCARNIAGQASEVLVAQIVRDTIAPRVFASNPANGANLRRVVESIDITLKEDTTQVDPAATLAGATVRNHLGADVLGQWQVLANHVTFTPDLPLTEDGTYTVTIHPTDMPLGNTGSETVVFAIDMTPPAGLTLNEVQSPTRANRQTLAGTKEPGSAVWVDGTQIVALNDLTEWSYNLPLSEGTNTHRLFTQDAAGNRSNEIVFAIILDSLPPVLQNTEPVSGTFLTESPVRVAFAFTDATTGLAAAPTLASARLRNAAGDAVDGSWLLEGAGTLVFTPAIALPQGTYTASLQAQDLAGNRYAAAFSFTFDITPPPVPSLNPVTTPTRRPFQMLAGTKEVYSSIWINGTQVVPLNASTNWSYTVRLKSGDNSLEILSRDAAGNQSPTVASSIFFDDTPPVPVTQLQASGNGDGTTVRLDWSGYPEADQGDIVSYRVYVAEQPFTTVSGLTPFATVPAGTFSFTFSHLITGTRYYFAVVAVDLMDTFIAAVTLVSAVPVDTQPPEDIASLRVQSFADSLFFSWNPSANSLGDLAGYRVYFNEAPQGIDLPSSQTSFEASGLSPATAYPLVVKAVDTTGNESPGTRLAAITWLANPATVTPAPQGGKVDLTWSVSQPASFVDHYSVYVSTAAFLNVAGITPRVTVKGTSGSVAGLTNGVTYYFAVTAVNLSGGENPTVTAYAAKPQSDHGGPAISDVRFNSVVLGVSTTIQEPGTFTATATDPSGVSRVEFRLDGSLFRTDANGSNRYSAAWNPASVADGSHSLTLTAFDTLGNSSTAAFNLEVALRKPVAPTITAPATGLLTNKPEIMVSGRAEKSTEILIHDNGAVLSTPSAVDAGGNFAILLTLVEGSNRLEATARNRAGESPKSAAVTVTLDSTLPRAPTSLDAQSKPGGAIHLSWYAPVDSALKGFNLYRAPRLFSSPAEAVKINGAPLTVTSLDDLPTADGTYTYRVTALDSAGNESEASNAATAVSDRTPPRAASIVYEPQGAFDPVTGRTAPGLVNVRLTVNEALTTTPFLSLTPHGGVPMPVELTAGSPTQYQGLLVIADTTSSGTAYAVFSARDLVGNRGTEIDTGKTLEIDTAGPAVSRLEIQPKAPIKNDQAQPVTVTVSVGLSEAGKPGSTPEMTWALSKAGRTPVALSGLQKISPQPGQAESWRGELTLPASGGLTEVETLSFTYRGRDDLDNISTRIMCENRFQVYQGDLPPLEAPVGLIGKALPAGRIKLSWQPVVAAVDYLLYRRAPGESALSAYQRSGMATEFTDTPPVDGDYTYAVASVRQENGQEAVSGMSAQVTVTSDSIPPGPPRNLNLQLIPQGINAVWQAPVDDPGGPITYSLYRADAGEITSLTGLTPIIKGVKETTVLDPHPSVTDHCYVVAAVDAAGNISQLSNSYYLNFGLLPVSSLKVVVSGTAVPLIFWTHPGGYAGGAVVGYNVSVTVSGQTVKLNQAPVAATSFTDTGYGGEERTYTITAVDDLGVESLGRSITLPVVQAAIKEGETLKRGVMNRLEYSVASLSGDEIRHMRVKVQVAGRTHTSEEFTLGVGETRTVPVAVGGYANLPDTAGITTTLAIAPHDGETIEIIAGAQVEVGDGMLVLNVANDPFTRGMTGQVHFTLENTGEEEIEITTATRSGAAASTEITFYLSDADGNVLTAKAYQQGLGAGIVTLANGNSVARIAPGTTFNSEPAELFIPLTAPDQVYVKVAITKTYYHQGKPEQVAMDGLSARHGVTLGDTSYYGEVAAVSPESSNGDQPIVITGHAIDRASLLPLGSVVLKMVISLSGFERTFSVATDSSGAFTHTFSPLAGESGLYKVWAVHPEVLDKPVQKTFAINRLSIIPANVNLNVPKNYQQSLAIKVATGDGTLVTNLELRCDAVDQPGGALPAGVHVTVGAPIATLGSRQTGTLGLTLWADNSVAATGRLILRVRSTEKDPWGWVTVNMQFSDAQPVLGFAPSHVETGVAYGGSVSETLTLDNRGLAALNDVTLTLLSPDNSPAPSWVQLVSGASQGSLAVGEKRPVTISFSPTATSAPEGILTYKLQVTSSNYRTVDIPIYVTVTQAGVGNALFKVTDIYTGTLGSGASIIQGLTGANIRLQNEQVTSIERVLATDSLGEAYFTALPPGHYKYRVTANNHQEQIGRIWIKAGITVTDEVFLDYNLVTVEWEVKETTIQDHYTIILKITYETDVPAAVVVTEPSSIYLPAMAAGDVYQGEFNLTNYGLIRAEGLTFSLPQNDPNFRYELISGLPESIDAKGRITVPYRVTCLRSPSDPGGGGGSCARTAQNAVIGYRFVCANGVWTLAAVPFGFIYDNGGCSGTGVPVLPGGGGGSGSSGTWTIGYGGGGGTVPTPAPQPKPIEGVECWPVAERQEEPPCVTDEQTEAPAETDTSQDRYEFVASSVNLVLREYTDRVEDLWVKVPGGAVGVKRTFYGNAWHWEHERYGLTIKWALVGSQISSIDMAGVSYTASGVDHKSFTNGGSVITVLADGYLWQDKHGNWRAFDAAGRLTAYGTRSGAIGKVLYESGANGRVLGLADKNDRQVIWFEYGSGGNLAAARDTSNRRVAYAYSGGRLSAVTDVLGQASSYQYDAGGRLSKKTDALGRPVNISYDRYGNVAKVVDGDGHGHFFEFHYDKARNEYYAQVKTSIGVVKELWFDRDGDTKRVDINGTTVKKIVKDGRHLLITDERGETTRKERDEWFNVTRIIHPDGNSVAYEYEHRFGRLVKMTDERGVVTLYSYDGAGNLIAKTEAVGTTEERVTRFTYDADGNLLTVKRPGDAVTVEAVIVNEYDADGNLITNTDAEGNISRFTYGVMGNVLSFTNAVGNTAHLSYDTAGRLSGYTDPLEQATRFEYDAVGNKTKVVDAKGHVTSFEYDLRNRLIRATDALGNTGVLSYDADGSLIAERDPEGKGATYSYDARGRINRMIDGHGDEILFEYEYSTGCSSCAAGFNQPAKIIFPTFTREYRYNPRGWKVLEKDILSADKVHSTSYAYDAAGSLLAWDDSEGRRTRYFYDGLERLRIETDAEGFDTHYSYDNRDNLIALTDANGNRTRFAYDRNNLRVKETRPMGEEFRNEYNALGYLARVIDAKGQQICYDYDVLARLTTVRYFAAADPLVPVKTATFGYDEVGNLAGYDDGVTSATYQYDALNRRLAESVNYGAFELSSATAWYGNGAKKSFTGPDGITYEYGHDANNQLASIAIPGQGFVTVNAYHWFRPAALSLPGGTTREFTYDALMRVQSIESKDPAGNPLLSYGYAYDRMDNVVTKTTEHGSYAYRYDPLYQLTQADRPSGPTEAYAYDGVGNRLTAAGTPGTWAYDANNQLQSYDDVAFTYDANGNIAQKRVDTSLGAQVSNFIYDVDNRLIRVEDGSGAVIAAYGYDPFGRRLWKEVSGTRTYFFYAAEGLIGEYDADGTEIKTYGYRPRSPWTTNPLFMKQGTEYSFYHTDHLGTPMLMTSTTGAIVWSAKYDAFGRAAIDPASTITNNLRLSGQYYDQETSLHYNYQRSYDPSTGRYLTPDPIGLAGGINLFAYCFGNPSNLIDPTGEIGVVGALIGAAIGGVSAYSASGGEFWSTMVGIAIGATSGFFGQFGGTLLSGALIGALVGSAEDLAWQLAVEKKSLACLDLWRTGRATLLGVITGGIGKRFPGGKRAPAPKSVPNPHGKMGSPRHQAYIEDEVRGMQKTHANNHDIEVRTEVRVIGQDGQIRYIDAQAVNRRKGEIVDQVQVGRTNKNGTIIARERRNMEDIDRTTSFDTRYRSYDR